MVLGVSFVDFVFAKDEGEAFEPLAVFVLAEFYVAVGDDHLDDAGLEEGDVFGTFAEGYMLLDFSLFVPFEHLFELGDGGGFVLSEGEGKDMVGLGVDRVEDENGVTPGDGRPVVFIDSVGLGTLFARLSIDADGEAESRKYDCKFLHGRSL